jgi:hypothetical protein
MLKRLFTGFLKGAVIGGALAAGLQFGLGWVTTAGWQAYLLAMGAGGITAVLTGKPPWAEGAWIESLLKGVAGMLLGTAMYWAAAKFLPFSTPFPLGPSAAGLEWTEVPLAYLTTISAVIGLLIDLDNTGGSGDSNDRSRTRVRVSADQEVEEAVVVQDERRQAR